MANTNRLTPPVDTVPFRLSPTMEREYKRREVFPELRLENAVKIINGATGVFELSVERAEELLEDVRQQRARRELLPRGMLVAYNGVEDQLRAALKVIERRGAWDDPGKAEALQRVRNSSAIFNDGDEVLYFGKGDEYGQPGVILGSYSDAIHYTNKDGHFLGDDGKRFDYRPGYVVQLKNGQTGFAPAHTLTRADCKPSHLRLVNA